MIIYAEKCLKNPKEIITAFDNDSVISAFNRIEELKNKYHIAGYIRYEVKDIFLGRKINSKLPLMYFECFENYEKFENLKNPPQVFLKLKPEISYDNYTNAIQKIKDEISNGNTYEVNYTCDFSIETLHSGEEIFYGLMEKQKTPYCSFIKNEFEEIISFSPELFFRKNGNNILTKPMKGTIKRGKNPKEDEELKTFLKNDEKNKAENVMIVDLLRNDLGKIAKTSSVKVPKLFEIETHKTLHQMTSKITAELTENTTIFDIFNAIFPCGSITGAPKISTMDIIDKTETGKRNVYCGAIGYIHKDFCEFSVPIRTLQKPADKSEYNYRAGGAIVWDSSIEDEWEEVKLKTSFLTENRKNWKLIETLRVKNLNPIFFAEHIERLKKSAQDLGYNFNKKIHKISFKQDGIYRIELSQNGDFQVCFREFSENSSNKIRISPIKVSSKDLFLYHKTNFRPYFGKSFEAIKSNEIYDEIFFNEKGELTEGARSNIIIKKDGKFYTPKVSCGLLNGIYRQYFLANFTCEEKVLYLEDLKSADNIYCVNSVRGMTEVKL